MAPEKTSALVGPGAAGMIAEKSSAPAGQKGAVNLGDPSLNVKARVMQPHGSYVRVKPKDGAKLVRSQSALIAIAREGG